MKVWTINRVDGNDGRLSEHRSAVVASTTDEAKVNGLRAAARQAIEPGSSDWIEVREG